MGGSTPVRTILIHEYVNGGGLAGLPWPASWAAEGRAMRSALIADFSGLPGLRVVATLDDRLPDEPGPWSIVRVGPGEELSTFARLAAEADLTTTIAPETGGLLAERARIIDRVGGRSMGSTPEAIELGADKYRLGRHLHRQGVSTPFGIVVRPAEGLPVDFYYPAVLKPVDGAGAVDTFYIEGPGSCPEAARAMPSALLQPFGDGVPLSATFLVGADGDPTLLGIGRQWVERRPDGRFAYEGGTIPAPDGLDGPSEPARLAIAAVPGLRGLVGVDFLRDRATGRDSVLEINPRLTTSYVGLRRLFPPGTLARAWLDTIDGSEAPAMAHPTGRVTFLADGTILPDVGPRK